VISSCGVLADLLESIEKFVDHLKVYSEFSPTPAIDQIVADLIVKLITTFAVVTQRLTQRRSREFLLAEVLPYSVRRSRLCEELFCDQGYKGRPSKAGSTHAR
jgi:hypothetical protein